jgi:GR25 family glycosyltransferase involved in LPS biosynthesis
MELEEKIKTLYSIFKDYSCRKSSNGFSSLIENFLISITDNNPSILEIGVGTVSLDPPEGRYYVPENMNSWKKDNPNYQPGNSLRAFRDFLNTGTVYGIDIQKDCEIDEDRIKTFIFDSRNPFKSKDFIENKTFDLIIDDSDKDANIRIITLNNFYPSLSDNGFYIFEGFLEKKLLEDYFLFNNIPYIVIDDFMIMNKKNNFNLINDIRNRIVSQNNIEPQKNEVIKDYKDDIQSTPKFSIDGNVFADKGFYINLERSVERKENVDNLINEFNIEGLLRFEALTDDMIQFACTKSHLQVFRTCLENDIESVFIAEDDFNIDNILYQPNSEPVYFREKIKLIKQDLDNLEWDVFLFGCNPKTHLVPLTNNVAIINKSTGAWAYIIKKRAFEFLIKNLNYKRDYIAIDDYLPILNDNGFNTLTSIPLTIGHAVGFVSTLQPRGPVNYTDWIRGNYYKFLFDNYPDNNFVTDKLEKNLTIFIPGFFCDNYLMYLRYALKSLPNELRKCKFIIRFDTPSKDYDLSEFIKLQAYFRDVRSDLNVSLSYGFGGLISSFDYFLKNVKTQYFMMFEFDYVFLDKKSIKFEKIIDSFNKYSFINTVYFSGDDISPRGFDLSTDIDGITTPFEIESRVPEINLVSTTRWSNRPAIHRVYKMKEWFETYMKNEHIGILHQSFYGIEDCMIPIFHKTINENKWENIKDDWGTYLYGNFGEGPFIAHTDSSKRYQNEIKSILEINADKYMKDNPLNETD